MTSLYPNVWMEIERLYIRRPFAEITETSEATGGSRCMNPWNRKWSVPHKRIVDKEISKFIIDYG